MKTKTKKQAQGSWKLNNGNQPLDLSTLPRCEAIAKSTGKRCGNPAMKGKMVCYIHGGKSPGPPIGNNNAYKHGAYTKEINELVKLSRDLALRAGEHLNSMNEDGLL